MRRPARTQRAKLHAAVESLESRRLMAVFPVAINTTALSVTNTFELNNYVVNGTAGNDVINVNYSSSPLTGRRLVIQRNNEAGIIVQLNATQGVSINGLEGNDYIKFTGAQTVFMSGGPGNDNLISGSGNDNLMGNDGDDIMDGGLGSDNMQGGAGNDTADYSKRTRGVTVTIDGLYNDGEPNERDNVAIDTEGVKGSNFADQIFGGSGNNNLQGLGGDDLLRGGNGQDIIKGGAGNDQLFADNGFYDDLDGEAGNDKIFGGAGPDFLRGGANDDIIVSIGGGQTDYVYGNAGFDSFWMDSESTERLWDADSAESARNVHRIANFEEHRINGQNFGAPSRELVGQNFVDPLTRSVLHSYKSFSTTPLYVDNTGPSPDDVNQGSGVADCYFMAPLAALAKTNPNVIRQAVVELGDGTYAVEMRRDGVKKYIRVDADMPVDSLGNMVYAQWRNTGPQMWVPVMEKAWAYFRNSTGTYEGIRYGYAREPYAALGVAYGEYDPYAGFNDSPAEFMSNIVNALNGGYAVTLCTDSGTSHGVPVLNDRHCYTVDSVIYDSAGVAVSLVLRDPYGTDGLSGDTTNDGYIMLSRSDARNACNLIVYGRA
jgi:hypothetical protein